MSGLTVRIDADRVVASDDDGRTAVLPPSFGHDLRAAFERAPATGPDELTAGTLAALAEARQTRPQPPAREAPAWQDTEDGPRMELASQATRPSLPLAAVLTARRSERRWAPPRLSDIATVLMRAGRIMDWALTADGYVTTRRPVPSAGARHPLDVHVLAGNVDGLAAGAWRFDALHGALVRTARPHEPTLARLGAVLNTESAPAAVVAVAHLHRTLSRYPTGLSLLWRDAGAMLTALQLCATDAGLASCITGTCGVMVDEPTRGVIDVGALVLGRRVALGV